MCIAGVEYIQIVESKELTVKDELALFNAILSYIQQHEV